MILYGSNVADSALSSACDLASASGGVETSATTTNNGLGGTFMEVTSKGLSNVPTRASIPAPTGNGWVFSPGAGTFAADNWSAVLTFACSIANAGASTLRFYQYTGTYSAIGSLTFTPTSSAKTTYTVSAVSMPATTFNAGDLLYIDLWYQDNSSVAGDTATIYESTSATAGVSSDMQITTSAFTPAGTVAALDIATRFLLEDPPPLVLYGSATADTTLTTACDLTSASGGTETSLVTTNNGLSGTFMEVTSKGLTSVPCQASIPAPTGNGWVYRPGTGTILAGNWSAIITMACSLANSGASTLRFYQYNSGIYTAIGSINFTPTATVKTSYSLTPTLMPAVVFGAADLLYVDLWYQDASGVAGDTVTIYESVSVAAGVAGDFQVTTYNWQPAVTVPSGSGHRPRWVLRPLMGGIFTPFQPVRAWVERAISGPFVRNTQPYTIGRYIRRGLTNLLLNYQLDIPTRLRLRSADQFKDIVSRFKLRSADTLKDIASRFKLRSTDQLKDISTRLLLASGVQTLKDIASRLRLRSADQLKDIRARLRLRSADQLKDVTARLRLRSLDQLRDIASRLRLRSTDQGKDVTTRLRLRSADQLKDIVGRLRLRSADQLKDVSTRFKQRSADQLKDIAARLKLAKFVDIATRLRLIASQFKDVSTRLRLRSTDQLKDIASRLRLRSADQLKDIKARFWLVLGTNRKDISSRLRQRSADQLKDITTRLVLASATQRLKDVVTRLRLRSADKLVDIASRLRLRSADQARDIASRFRQRSGNQLKDMTSRLRLMSASQLKDVLSRLRLRSADQVKDIPARFRQMSVAQRKDVASRLRLMSALQLKDIASRLRQISQPQPKDIRARLILVIFAVTTKDIHCRLILVEYHVSHITVVSPCGQVDAYAPRSTLTAVGARGTLRVEEE